jgi:hypothetical protein
VLEVDLVPQRSAKRLQHDVSSMRGADISQHLATEKQR